MKDIDQYGAFTEQMWVTPVDQSITEQPHTELAGDLTIALAGLGLAGESGEVVEHIKKLLRDGYIDMAAIKKELGDAVYYWARICRYFGFLCSDVLDVNIEKLESRRMRNVQHGSGSDR